MQPKLTYADKQKVFESKINKDSLQHEEFKNVFMVGPMSGNVASYKGHLEQSGVVASNVDNYL